MPLRLPLATVLVCVAIPVAAVAAGPLTISTRMLVERRVAAADGTTATRLVAPTSVVPGDRVAVVLDYRNTGAAPLTGVVLANPVPPGMAYRGTTAADTELSIDGKTFGALADLRVPVAGAAPRPATVDDIRHVRWRLSIPAGATGERRFQAVLR